MPCSGAAVVGAVAALAAVGTITGDQAITLITGITTFVLGVGATQVGANSQTHANNDRHDRRPAGLKFSPRLSYV